MGKYLLHVPQKVRKDIIDMPGALQNIAQHNMQIGRQCIRLEAVLSEADECLLLQVGCKRKLRF